MDDLASQTPDRGGAAWFAASIGEFVNLSVEFVLGRLVQASGYDVTQAQRDAWAYEIIQLQSALTDVIGYIALEFAIPRLGSRVDAIVLAGPAIFPIEFKVGESSFLRADYNQVWDYALELKNFHAGSRTAPIFPILLASGAVQSDATWAASDPDGIRPPRRVGPDTLVRAIRDALDEATGEVIDGATWAASRYCPTPTIIEAARRLYARHTVEAISRNDAGATNLSITSGRIEAIIDCAVREHFKAIVFVTGVPGAGKTLVGLNIATQRRSTELATHAVFLSGNGPLVAVLREALTRDELARRKVDNPAVRKGIVGQEVKLFIQNIHHFRDDGIRTLASGEAPHDRVVIFDEAQRAWNIAKTMDFMKRRKGVPGFDRSEPQFLIEYMDRHPDWAVVVCLVGGGQEINTGEAGISTWLDAIREHYPGWRVYISPQLGDSEYASGHALDCLRGVARIESDAALHLSTSMRAFRSEKVSAFVKALLDLDVRNARSLLDEVARTYPIVLTRDIETAKRWTRKRARGTERYGLVASSGAQRLKPYAIDVRVDIDPVHWFLGDPEDTRSSYYLEDPATEYQIQGLELDWTCVTWDADLRHNGDDWDYRNFSAKGWFNVRARDRRQYLINAYRVLLTRARQGMVIFVPTGSTDDPTRLPKYYDDTYAYLRSVGIPAIGQ